MMVGGCVVGGGWWLWWWWDGSPVQAMEAMETMRPCCFSLQGSGHKAECSSAREIWKEMVRAWLGSFITLLALLILLCHGCCDHKKDFTPSRCRHVGFHYFSRQCFRVLNKYCHFTNTYKKMSYNSCTAFVVIVMTMLNVHCHFFHRLTSLASEALESYRRLFTYSYFPLRPISLVGTT